MQWVRRLLYGVAATHLQHQRCENVVWLTRHVDAQTVVAEPDLDIGITRA